MNGFWTGVTAWGLPFTFVDNRNYPGGPASFIDVEYSTLVPINAASVVIAYLSSMLSDALLVSVPSTFYLMIVSLIILMEVWRCFVIYSACGKYGKYAVFLPGTIYVASIGWFTLYRPSH